MKLSNKVLVMGGVILDNYLVVDKYPAKGQDACIADSFERVGGCAVNVSATLKNLECEPYLVSTLGDDTRGTQIYEYLKKKGFKTDCIKAGSKERTGYCHIILDETGERTFLTYKGCEAFFSPGMIGDGIVGDISFVYLTGYYLLNQKYHEAILSMLKKLKAAGSKILFDPGPLVGNIDTGFLSDILEISNVVVPNAAEREKITEKLLIKEPFAEWCLKKGMELVVVKMGKRGAHAWNRDKYISVPTYKVDSKDTTGAGDSFAGGLIFSMINHYSIEETVKIANACGSITTSFVEPHAEFKIEDVMHLLNHGEENS